MSSIYQQSISKLQNTTSIVVLPNGAALALHFARHVLERAQAASAENPFVAIMPVGPTGQWKEIVRIARAEKISLKHFHIISMDEYLHDDGYTILNVDHPMSFAGFIQRNFLDEAVAHCDFQIEHWVAPNPQSLSAVDSCIAEWGGVDVCYAGIGLNGHMAFNEPPEPGSSWTETSFADSPVRIQKIAASTTATNAIFGTGGAVGLLPDYAVTLGLRQILSAKQIQVFLDWPWQSNILRRCLLGECGMQFPASLLQRHPQVQFSITEEVAQIHHIIPE